MLKPVTQLNMIDWALKSKKTNVLIKEALYRFSENPAIKNSLERMPSRDLFNVWENYKTNPELYDDMFNGKVKFKLKGVSELALPVYDKDINTGNVRDLLAPESLIGKVIKMFDAFSETNGYAKKISLKMNGEKLSTAVFDKNDNTILSITRSVDDTNNILFKMLNAADDKKLDLIRE